MSSAVAADLAPIFHALPPARPDEGAGPPEIRVLRPRGPGPARRAGLAPPARIAAGIAVVCTAAFGVGILRETAPPAPAFAPALATAAVAPAAVARASLGPPKPPACAEAACREPPPVRPAAARVRVRRVAARHAPRPFDWSVYEEATRPIFRDRPAPAAERTPAAAGRWMDARRVATNYTPRPFDWSRYERATRPTFRGGGSGREPSSSGLY